MRRAFRRRRPPSGALLSTSVGPLTRRPTATPVRAGFTLILLFTRHARNSSGSSRRHSRSTNCGRSSSSRSGARNTPRRCSRSGHTRQASRCSQGRGARQVHEELGKLLHNRRESGHGRPSCNRSDAHRSSRNHRRLRGNRLNTLLDSTSGQPSCFLGPQAGRRSR